MNKTIRDQAAPRKKAARRTEPPEVRRSQLIDATIESIAAYGIGGTTMSTVTEIAGLSVGLVNFHFENKQNLLEETLVFLAREHHEHWKQAYMDAGLSAQEKLLAIVDAHFHPRICTRKKLAVWYAFFGEAGRRKVYRKLIDGIDDERFDLSIGLCEEIIRDGGYDVPPASVIARMLEGLYDGLQLNILMYPGHITRKQANNQIRAYLASVFPQHIAAPAF
ncbi:TetR/AcrR family transcriptional regulator [Yoonia sp.]|uniref:TetR/AcrR family transcriptional regulator n=1 Tax=Yoonia sp. TaxID=2212373 RepID=UPI002FDA0D15